MSNINHVIINGKNNNNNDLLINFNDNFSELMKQHKMKYNLND